MNFMIEYEKGVPDMCCERQDYHWHLRVGMTVETKFELHQSFVIPAMAPKEEQLEVVKAAHNCMIRLMRSNDGDVTLCAGR